MDAHLMIYGVTAYNNMDAHLMIYGTYFFQHHTV